MKTRLAALALLAISAAVACSAQPLYRSELIFPPERYHNHASCIIQCPNGDLLACWYRGVGPEKGDDVQIMGARKVKGKESWSRPFLMADTPGYPDDNPCMFIDPKGRLWLLWPTLLANQWGSAIMKYRISSHYQMPDGPPRWDWQDVIHVTPADFERQIAAGMELYMKKYPDLVANFKPQVDAYMKEIRERSADRLTQRLGWMTRVHPTVPALGAADSAPLHRHILLLHHGHDR